jgi:hypothetical protein
LIFLVKEYFNFTKDTTFLKSKNENVLNAVEYIESLIAERSNDHFKYGNDSVRAYYGLVTESISHEGYSAKPMHSYWDNFFTLKGLKDAAEIQLILGEKENYERIKRFVIHLRKILQLTESAMIEIDYIPLKELSDIQHQLRLQYLLVTNCKCSHSPMHKTLSINIMNSLRTEEMIKLSGVTHAYENRLIAPHLFGSAERAHELIKFFLNDQEPQVGIIRLKLSGKMKDIASSAICRTLGRFDFITQFAQCLYVNLPRAEDDSSIVIGATLYQD